MENKAPGTLATLNFSLSTRLSIDLYLGNGVFIAFSQGYVYGEYYWDAAKVLWSS